MPGISNMASGSSGSTGQTSYPPMPGFPMPTAMTGGQQNMAALPFPGTGSSIMLDNTSTMMMDPATLGGPPDMMGGGGHQAQASAALPQQPQQQQANPAVTTSGSIPNMGLSGSNPGPTPLQYAAVLPGSRYQIQVNTDGSHQVIHVQQPPNAGSLTIVPPTVAPGGMPSGSSVGPSTGGQTSYPPTNS